MNKYPVSNSNMLLEPKKEILRINEMKYENFCIVTNLEYKVLHIKGTIYTVVLHIMCPRHICCLLQHVVLCTIILLHVIFLHINSHTRFFSEQ